MCVSAARCKWRRDDGGAGVNEASFSMWLVFIIERASAVSFLLKVEYKVRKLMFSYTFNIIIFYYPFSSIMLLLHLHFGRFRFIKQGLIIDWVPLSQLSVCAFVWLVDPLHVGPPAPRLLTRVIKGKGLTPSIPRVKMKGTLNPSTTTICISSSTVVGGFWPSECALCLRDMCHVWPNPFGLPSPGQDVHPSVWGLHAKTAVIRSVSTASTPAESTCPQLLLIPACLHNAAQYGFGFV